MADTAHKPTSPLRDALRIFVRNKPALLAFLMIFALAVGAVTGVMFTGKKPDAKEKIRLEEAALLGDRVKLDVNPNAVRDPIKTELRNTFLQPMQASREADNDTQYWLGSDHLGRDVLARLWAGSSISLTIGFLAVGISVLLGITLGGIAGYFGRDNVGLPMLATLLAALGAGISFAAEFPGLGWLLAFVVLGLFIFQLLVAFAGKRIKVALFFVGCALMFGVVVMYDGQIETTTPEGQVAQAAGRVAQNSKSLLLEVRDFGARVKEWENSPEAAAKEGEKPAEPPAWRIAGQVSIDTRTRMIDIDVLRYQLQAYASGQQIARRLADEQAARAEYLDSRAGAYKDRFDEAVRSLEAANAAFAAAEKQGNEAEIKRTRKDVLFHDDRRGAFDPQPFALRTEEIRRTSVAERARSARLIELMAKPIDEYRAALDAATAALQEVLKAAASTRADLRQRSYEIEAALRAMRVAQSKFNLADAQAQAEGSAAALEAAKAYAGGLKDGPAKQPAENLVKALTSESEGRTAAIERRKNDLADKEKKVKDLAEHIEAAKAVMANADGADKDKELAALDGKVPLLPLEGSYPLIDRRGVFRKAFVQKYESEAKNKLQEIANAETLNGQHRYGLYRILRHFLTFAVLGVLLLVSGLAVLAAAQGAVVDRLKMLRPVFLPTISVDNLVMRFTEIMMTIPVIFLILAVLALFEKDVFITMAVIGLTSWMGTTRFVRAEILSLREQDFIQAARSLGVSDFRIIWRHLVPNAISPVLVSATLGVAGAVLAESTLSFLGIGAGPNQSTWGQILSEGREYINDAPWLSWIPGVAILITVLCFNLLGEGLREAFNPKLRGR